MMTQFQIAADIAKCLSDPTRLKILQFLHWGGASVSELVAVTASTQPNISNHLKLLREHNIVTASKNGRMSIYEIQSPAMAELIGALSWVAFGDAAPIELPVSGKLAEGRACFDHLAGRIGVQLFAGLIAAEAISEPIAEWAEVQLGPNAKEVFSRLDIDLSNLTEAPLRRRFACECPDWTEHGRTHIGGLLGAAILNRFVKNGWVTKDKSSRAVTLTKKGKADLKWVLQLSP